MQALQGWIDAQQMGLPENEIIASLNQAAVDGLQSMARGLVLSGLTVVNLLTLVFITPIVTIYMLNDWDRMVAGIDALLPSHQAALIRQLASQMDAMLSGFLRGQIMVCLALGVIYALGLSWVGLKGGLVLGFIAGLISFIPYVGAAIGMVVAGLLGLGQFGIDWMMLSQIAAVFAVGQFIEGNVLTPRLVGDRVRLHPVWIMFALLAMGHLFGFLGLLLAVPVAAICGVVVRHAAGVYQRDYVSVPEEKTDG
jgi:predicted PurR-regulated permease PerM